MKFILVAYNRCVLSLLPDDFVMPAAAAILQPAQLAAYMHLQTQQPLLCKTVLILFL